MVTRTTLLLVAIAATRSPRTRRTRAVTGPGSPSPGGRRWTPRWRVNPQLTVAREQLAQARAQATETAAS